MTDRPNFSKGSPAATPAGGSAAPRPAPPKFVLYTVVALGLSGVMAVLASAALYTGSVRSWVRDNTRDSLSNQMSDKFDEVKKAGPGGGARATELTTLQNQIKQLKNTDSTRLTPLANSIKADIKTLTPGASKKGKTALSDLDKQADNVRDLDTQISKQQRTLLISSIIVLIALGIAAGAAYRGRYWARWAVLGLWVLATLTGTSAGVGYVLSVGANIPALYKVPAFISGLSLIIAVVLVNLRPSVAYYALTKPERGARQQRRGLFSPPPPREPRGAATTPPATTPPATTDAPADAPAGPDRARTKQRTSEAAVAKGAELARSRAKSSKSRRTGA